MRKKNKEREVARFLCFREENGRISSDDGLVRELRIDEKNAHVKYCVPVEKVFLVRVLKKEKKKKNKVVLG